MKLVTLHVLYDLGMEHEWIVGYKCWHGICMHDNVMLGWRDMILVWFRT